MKVVDIADEIYRELDEPSDLSIPPISFWVRTNLGGLNNLLNTTFLVEDDAALEIEDEDGTEITQQEAAILKKMYLIHFYDVKIRASLGAASVDTVVELSSDGSRIKKINKNEQSKTYYTARLQLVNELSAMITGYKSKNSSPLQVAGDDTVAASESVNRQGNILYRQPNRL